MNVAVRYYSRSGNTKAIAEALAKATGVKAVSADDEKAVIDNDVDLLFVGGALYAYGIDEHLSEFLKNIDGTKIRRAVVFSSSWISKHAIELIRKALEEKGVTVESEAFYVRGKPSADKLAEAEAFAKKYM